MYCILKKVVVQQWMGPAMEQCNEADMTIDQRDLKYIFTSAMRQRPSIIGFTSKYLPVQ